MQTVFTFSVVVEDAKETLYLAYRSAHPVRCTNEYDFDRLVKKFFILNEENVLDFADDEMEEIQQIANGDAANGENGNAQNSIVNDAINGADMVSELYRRLRHAHFEHDRLVTMDTPVQHAAMKARLKSYQAAAVRWMLHRELCQTDEPMFKPVFRRWPPNDDDAGEHFSYNPYTFELSSREMPAIKLPSGGILADEMGLGKTVEALALILLNKRPANDLMNHEKRMVANVECIEIDDSDDHDDDEYVDDGDDDSEDCAESPPQKRRKANFLSVKCICDCASSADPQALIKCSKCALRQHRRCVLKHVIGDVDTGNYICPQCWNSEEPVKSAATIIVSPRSIKSQWFHEVQKHITADNFKVRNFPPPSFIRGWQVPI